MKIRFFWSFLGAISFTILIPVSISSYNDYQVYKNGSVVDVVLTFLPRNNTTKTDNMEFEMNGDIYDKKVYASFSNAHHVGDKIKLKYLAGYDNFLFPNESPLIWDIMAILLIICLGISCFYYAYKKHPLSNS